MTKKEGNMLMVPNIKQDMLDTLSKKYNTLKSEAKESYADGKEPVQNSIDQGNF